MHSFILYNRFLFLFSPVIEIESSYFSSRKKKIKTKGTDLIYIHLMMELSTQVKKMEIKEKIAEICFVIEGPGA